MDSIYGQRIERLHRRITSIGIGIEMLLLVQLFLFGLQFEVARVDQPVTVFALQLLLLLLMKLVQRL
jgi:hypothetical protein